MNRLFCRCLSLIPSSFGTSGMLWFMTVAFPGYLHLYFCNGKNKHINNKIIIALFSVGQT